MIALEKMRAAAAHRVHKDRQGGSQQAGPFLRWGAGACRLGVHDIHIQMCEKTAVMCKNSVKCEYTSVELGARRIIKADYYEFGRCPSSWYESRHAGFGTKCSVQHWD